MSHPNILLVTIDSLRYDAVFNSDAHAGIFRRLTNNSVVYEKAFSQGPFTTFSMPSLFTSQYPSSLSYVEFSQNTTGVYIDNEPTLPSILRDTGYETAGFHSNPLLSNLFGFDSGFNTFDARLPFSNTALLSGRAKILADKVFRIIRKHPYLPAEKVNERALQWIDDRSSDEPFFLWIHYMDVHGPYIGKDGFHYLNKFRGERLWRKAVKQPEQIAADESDRLRALYCEEIKHVDDKLGELCDSLRSRGLWDELVVAVTSDHGEGFGERGKYSHPHLLYDELIHVPLLVRDPVGATGIIDSPVELVGLAPTLIERAGGTLPASFSGAPLPTPGEEVQASPTAISEADIVPQYNGSVRTERYRYIRNDLKGEEELYNVLSDPRQRQNVVDYRPKVRDELATILEDHLSAQQSGVGEDRDVVRAEIEDYGVRGRLQDLGYLE